MDNIESKKIHSVLIDFLKLENNYEIDKLEILGNWYFRFLLSSEEKLNLHIPFYSVDFTLLAYRYVRCYTILYNLLKQDKTTQFEGTCLFDIFNKKLLKLVIINQLGTLSSYLRVFVTQILLSFLYK